MRIGIIGGGQLARMMYQSSIGIGVEVSVLCETPDSSAAQVVADVVVGDYRDSSTVMEFAQKCDVITFDHEHVPSPILRDLAQKLPVRPGPTALENAQDKAVMRANLADLPQPDWQICRDQSQLVDFGNQIGWPIIAKASRGGYDGHGVWLLRDASECGVPFENVPATSAGEPVVILGEEFVDFTRELSIIVARGVDGQLVSYPVSETRQSGGVCQSTLTPAPDIAPEPIERLAFEIAKRLDVVGLLAVELMQRASGEVVINELAMRPHNTGHWSIEGANTSQFENHLRAVAGLPLGDTGMRANRVAMQNFFGTGQSVMPALATCLSQDVHIHLYGKQPRPGRKIGHVTAYGDSDEVVQRAASAAATLMDGRYQ